MNTPIHAVIYRANQLWNQLSEAILHFASVYYEQGVKRGAILKVVKVFTENTSEAEISQWLTENEALLSDVQTICCDQTVGSIVGYEKARDIDECRDQVVEGMVGQREVNDVYRELLNGIFDAYQTKRVQLVKRSLSDYNPLKLEGCDGKRKEEEQEKYLAAFTALIPEGIKVEVVTDPMQLSVPDNQTVIIVHHHAIGMHKNSSALSECPRVLMSYLSGLVKKAFMAFDASSILPDTVVEETRKSLEVEYSRAENG